jgi:hypothetical protein
MSIKVLLQDLTVTGRVEPAGAALRALELEVVVQRLERVALRSVRTIHVIKLRPPNCAIYAPVDLGRREAKPGLGLVEPLEEARLVLGLLVLLLLVRRAEDGAEGGEEAGVEPGDGGRDGVEIDAGERLVDVGRVVSRCAGGRGDGRLLGEQGGEGVGVDLGENVEEGGLGKVRCLGVGGRVGGGGVRSEEGKLGADLVDLFGGDANGCHKAIEL